MEGTVNTNYQRVCPRDLFNEAKLLKCLGQLALAVLDCKVQGLKAKETGKSFKIGLHDGGYLTAVSGIKFISQRRTLWLGIPYNSRSNYPLICHHNWEDIAVFEEDGTITDEFRAFLTDTSL